jgi:hypothetical protein
VANLRSDEDALVELARDRLSKGRLPIGSPQRIWGGPGNGAVCALCEQVVTRLDIEFEVEFALAASSSRILHFHRRCHAIWDAERRPRIDRVLHLDVSRRA